MKKTAKRIVFLTFVLVIILGNTVIKVEQKSNALSLAQEITLPIVMYHSILKSRTEKYVISPFELEKDIIKYKELGYTPITLKEAVNWVYNRGELPEKPMVITFDDGHYNNLYYALPILKKHNAKAVVNIVTSFSQSASENTKSSNNPNFSYLTSDNIRELHESGLVEIGSHTHALHKLRPRYGIAHVSGETTDSYKAAVREDLQTANNFLTQKCGVPSPVTFAYPFGKYTKEGREILKDLGFKAILTCNEGSSVIRKGDPESLLTLKRYNRSGNVSRERFIKKVFGNINEA